MRQAPCMEKYDGINRVFERISDAFMAFDSDWNFTYVNKKTSEIMGKSPQALVGKNIWAENPELKECQLFPDFIKAMKEQKSFHAEAYLPLFNLWFHAGYYPSPEGLSVILFDITDQKKAKQAPEERKYQYQSSQEKTDFNLAVLHSIGQAVIATDLNGSITYWNKAAEEIYGWAADEAIGRNVIELLPSLLSQDEAKEIMTTLKTGHRWSGEFEVQRKDGSTFLAFVTNSPIKNNHGILSGVLGVSVDISMVPKAKHKFLAMEAAFKKLADNERLGHWEWDLNTNEIVLSDEMYQIFHLDPNGTVADQAMFFQFLHPEDRDWLRAELNAILEGIKKYDHVFRVVLNNGETRYMHGMGNLVKDHNGKISKFVGITQDITKQKLIEEELSISEKNYRLLFDKNPIPLYMLEFPSLNFLEVNQAAVLKYGYSREEFLTMNLRDLRADGDEPFLKTFYNFFETDPSQENVVRHKRKNGEILHVKIYTNTIEYDGKNVWLVAARNITKEIEFEKHLSESQAQLAIIYNNIVDALSLLRAEGPGKYRYEDVNEAYVKINGIEKNEVIGKLVGEIIPSANFEELFKAFDKSIEIGEIQKILSFHTGRNGLKAFDVTVVPVKDESGNFSKLLVIVKDVTDRKKAEDALLQSNAQLRELSSHLQKIREDDRTHIAREIHDELGQQLTGLKLDISWLSKNLNSNRQQLKNKMTDSLALIDETINSVRRIASELRPSILDHLGLAEALDWQSKEVTKRTGVPIEFTTNLNDPIPADISIGLFRIFQESVTNIARHAHATHVVCLLEKNDHYLQLLIKDNGIGFQMDESRRTLGLLGMQERVIMMNGRYMIKSAPGKGTEVNVEIPYTSI